MTLVDLVTTVIVVIILLALAVALATYAIRRVQGARRADPDPPPDQGSWYFVRYSPERRSDRRS